MKKLAEIIKNHNIKNLIFHIDPIEFYGNMIDIPVMGMEDIPDYFKDVVNQAINQSVSEFIETYNIVDTNELILELDIRVQVIVTNENAVCQFVIMLSDSGCKYDYTIRKITIKEKDCLLEFKRYYIKKLETLFFGDIKMIGGLNDD